MPTAKRKATLDGVGILAGGAQPLRDERDPHDHVADDHDREVEVLEDARHAGGDDEDAGDLDERQQPVLDVVGVVGGGEPGEVHPRPPDREEDDQVAEDAVGELPSARSWWRNVAAWATATTKQRSNRSSSGVAARCGSAGSRPDIRTCHGRIRGAAASLAHQWRKCRVPVISIAPPTASTAATTSASRTEPPGWAKAVTPAVEADLDRVGERVEGVGRARGADERGLACVGVRLGDGPARRVDPRGLTRPHPDQPPVADEDDRIRRHAADEPPGEVEVEALGVGRRAAGGDGPGRRVVGEWCRAR